MTVAQVWFANLNSNLFFQQETKKIPFNLILCSKRKVNNDMKRNTFALGWNQTILLICFTLSIVPVWKVHRLAGICWSLY